MYFPVFATSVENHLASGGLSPSILTNHIVNEGDGLEAPQKSLFDYVVVHFHGH